MPSRTAFTMARGDAMGSWGGYAAASTALATELGMLPMRNLSRMMDLWIAMGVPAAFTPAGASSALQTATQASLQDARHLVELTRAVVEASLGPLMSFVPSVGDEGLPLPE